MESPLTTLAAPPVADLAKEAERIADLAREQAASTERNRALSPELVAALRRSGLLRAGGPADIGAPEAPPAVLLAAAERIARGDAATGWCVAIAATSSLLGAYLPKDTAADLLGGENDIAAGVWAPRGKATPVDGGVRVTGRWPFSSGITHANWFFAGAVLVTGDPQDGAGAAPELRVVALPTAELEILDTWHTTGLRGTGSHDVVATDLFVPEDRCFSIVDTPPRVDTPLYRFPLFGYFALSVASAALGNARGAIDDFIELAVGKVGQGSSRTLAERPATQAAVAEAEAALRAARAGYYAAIEEAWAAAQDGVVGVEHRLGLRLAATHAVRTAADVTRSLYDLGGGTAIYEDSPLQRRFRDAHTATAHFQVNAATFELTGRLLLGLPAKTVQL
ncbi:acyl-CoA dehydrogenase family protein [Streptomyces sp. NPDC058371]|uniref:acyl-CoA dehydrogenase family protein n=1 Tax=Streptomyces sp. NPDC058371 TaxID=3346463 RepID=UPI003656FBAF